MASLLREIALSVRMLLRHAMTSDMGAGVPKVDLAHRIKCIDHALGGTPQSVGRKEMGKVKIDSLIKMIDAAEIKDPLPEPKAKPKKVVKKTKVKK